MAIFDVQGMTKSLSSQFNLRKDNQSARDFVEDMFKLSVAKLLECYITEYDVGSIESEFSDGMINELISCFRSATLEDGQMSEEDYKALYWTTMKEIVQGHDSGENSRTTESDVSGYVRSDGGLYVPGH